MAHEEWRDVVGYEGYYQVSNLGRVRSLDRAFVNCNGHHRFLHGRILKNVLDSRGYYHVTLSKDGVKRRHLIHRLVADAFLEPDPTRPFVDHINGIRTDNRVENLRRATPKENTDYAIYEQGLIDMEKRRRTSKEVAERIDFGHLTCKPVVRSDGKIYRSAVEASRDLGVSDSQVGFVARGKMPSCKGYTFWFLGEPEKPLPKSFKCKPILVDGEREYPSAAAFAKEIGVARQQVTSAIKGGHRVRGHKVERI